MSILDTSSTVAAVSRYREYYETDKQLGGLIKVNRITHVEKFGQEVHIIVPIESEKFDKFYINGFEFVPKEHTDE